MIKADQNTASSLLLTFIEAVPGAVYAKDREGRILLGNKAFESAIGCSSGQFVGKTDLELLADKQQARKIMETDQRIIAAGVVQQIEEELILPDGTMSYWISTKAPFSDSNGQVSGLVGVSVDVSERKLAQEREMLLAKEMAHRNKNLLSVVQSIVGLTEAPSIDSFRTALLGRIEALGRAQSLLAHERWQAIELTDLLEQELSPFGCGPLGRVQLSGPPLFLREAAAQPLAMAAHELATNAAKYGAMADGDGELKVDWTRNAEEQLVIVWSEQGSSQIKAPDHEGFGTRLLRTLIERQLDGSLAMDWAPKGLRCTITIPKESL